MLVIYHKKKGNEFGVEQFSDYAKLEEIEARISYWVRETVQFDEHGYWKSDTCAARIMNGTGISQRDFKRLREWAKH